MKLRGFATLLLIAMVSFAAPSKAETTVAVLNLDNQQKTETICPEELGNACTIQVGISDLHIAANTANRIAPAPTTDHIIMLSAKDGIACLVEAEGSLNGELSCGFVDND
ncbi:MAG: hypothetical protein HC770_11260 [Pseudanabaena sp. CRU_2_10]|nr:hypothetical protein [Pseudanabaena sp. CRU_2_10]